MGSIIALFLGLWFTCAVVTEGEKGHYYRAAMGVFCALACLIYFGTTIKS